MVRLSDGDTDDFFNTVAWVSQEDTLALNMFIICLDYVLQKLIYQIKENGFTLKRQKIVDIQQKLWLTQTT